MVLNFRKLIGKTIGDSYPLPYINDIFDYLGSVKYFSVFDLATGFHHIRMDPKYSQKTVFSTLQGHCEFDRMTCGLKTTHIIAVKNCPVSKTQKNVNQFLGLAKYYR